MTHEIARTVMGCVIALSGAFPGYASTQKVCVTNGAETAHFFVAEARGGARETRWLDPHETLCATATAAAPIKGVVSVFEDSEDEEGCSRLVSADQTETLLQYVNFDRCFWSSNSN